MAPVNEGDVTIPRNEYEALIKFQQVMLEKLEKNKHKGGWRGDKWQNLYLRLDQEEDEMYAELVQLDTYIRGSMPEHVIREQARKVAREAADVANFAMMIADVCGGL